MTLDKSALSSKVVAGVALCLWLMSLPRVGFVDPGPHPWSGFDILGSGWLGLGLVTAAWYANPLFLVSVLILLTGDKAPRLLTAIAFLLSLDTLRFAVHPPSSNFPTVYAYGIGAVFWFSALLMAMIAAGIRHVELRDGRTALGTLFTDPFVVFGSVALCISIASAMYWADNDRRNASEFELRALALAPIKRGPVCKEHVVAPQQTMLLDGPLELRGEGHPLTSPMSFLALGIPTVRIEGYDYALSDNNDLGSVFITPAIGTPSAKLEVEEKSGSWIRATLMGASDGRVLFTQAWAKGGRTGPHYCPDFEGLSMSKNDQPWKLLVQALGGSKAFHPPAVLPPSDAFGEVNTWSHAKSVSVHVLPSAEQVPSNISCPDDMGLVTANKLPRTAASSVRYGNGFRIGSRIFLSGLDDRISAACQDDRIYLFKTWENHGGQSFEVYLQSRSMKDFEPGSTQHFNVPYSGKMHLDGGSARSTLQLHRIVGKGNPLIVEIINTQSGEVLKVTADFTE